MEGPHNDIVLTIDSKRAFVLVILLGSVIYISYSYIVALFAFVAPSEDYPLHINSANSLDSAGTVATSFSRGAVVMVNVTLEAANQWIDEYYAYHNFTASVDYLMLVQIMRGSTPVYLGFLSSEVSPSGVHSAGVGLKIPGDASTGTYIAKIMIWDSWNDGGSILADNSGLETTFSVT